MQQDPTAIPTTPDLSSPSQRACTLYERVANALESVGALFDVLLTVSTSQESGADDGALDDCWSELASEVGQLETTATSLRRLGDTIGARLITKDSQTATKLPQSSAASAHDLQKLIAAQRTTLAALNQQLGKAESILSRSATDPALAPKRYGDVEIQDVSEFLDKSPIASVPINASYYQRILEAAHAPEGHKRPMGSILMKAGLITARQLENALKHQQEGQKRPLGTLLVDLGYTTDTAIAQTIAAQLALPFVTLSDETIQQEAINTIPLHVARRHGCFPVSLNDGALFIAMVNPLDLIALDDLRLASGKHVRPCVASREEIIAHINRHYVTSSF